jgi:hypothetical protein
MCKSDSSKTVYQPKIDSLFDTDYDDVMMVVSLLFTLFVVVVVDHLPAVK